MTFQPSVVLFRGRGLISQAIRWQTRSDVSHAALLLPGDQIIEAWQGAGVRTKVLSDWHGVERYTLQGIRPAQWERAVEFARAQIGKPYDYLGVLRFLTRDKSDDRSRWFCSELVTAALNAGGYYLFERTRPHEVSPGLLKRSVRLNRVPSFV